jgi:radical SAM protein with 4Fe4S-binding SPASM domain
VKRDLFDPGIGDAPPLPRFAQIEPMPSCNLACRMCGVSERPGGRDIRRGALSLQRFVEWLDQLPQIEELQLQGLGEPMLNPALFEMIRIAKSRNLRVSINSNLTLLTPRRAQLCIDSGLDEISVSTDGATRATYEHIRVGASFAKLRRNLDRLVAARRRAATAAPQIRLVMVLMRHNVDEVPALVDLAADHGVDAVLIQRLAHPLDEPTLPDRYIPIRTFVQTAQLGTDELDRARLRFDEARARADQRGVGLNLPRLHPAPSSGCRWPWEGLYLTADGEMLPCCMVGTPDRANFGTVTDSVDAVWRGDAAQTFRTALAGSAPPAICRNCALYRGVF